MNYRREPHNDVSDQIAYLITAKTEDGRLDCVPGSRIHMGEEGDVAWPVPDATALNADFRSEHLKTRDVKRWQCPRQAMGIHSGEKTAFVQNNSRTLPRIFDIALPPPPLSSLHFESLPRARSSNGYAGTSTQGNLDMIDT